MRPSQTFLNSLWPLALAVHPPMGMRLGYTMRLRLGSGGPAGSEGSLEALSLVKKIFYDSFENFEIQFFPAIVFKHIMGPENKYCFLFS